MPEIIKREFFSFTLRDVIELIVVSVGVIVYVLSGFSHSHETDAVTARDVSELGRTVSSLATTVRDIDNNGTRHSTTGLLAVNKDILENTRRIEALEKQYSSIYDIMNDIKVGMGITNGHTPKPK